jgi:hypothetical protein
MSHITKVKTQLKDGMILIKALRKLGYQVRASGSRESGEARDPAPEFLARRGSTRIRFKRCREDKAVYEMLTDWEGTREHREDLLNEIYQGYSQEKIVDLARLKGYSLMKNRMNERGQIEIVLRKMV